MRKNTQLECAGAEFLVLGNLLIEGISAYKAYQNFKGYDLVAVNPTQNTSARIQVKSRFQTNWDGFIINNFDCDFVVLVTLNRGYTKPKRDGNKGVSEPVFYVFPLTYVSIWKTKRSDWGKITKSRLIGHNEYKNRWDLIRAFLAEPENHHL